MATSDTLASFGNFDFQDVIEIVMRRWRWISVGALAGLALGMAAYWAMPRSYEATTTILVEPQGVPESYVRSTITVDVNQRIRTLHQRVTSHTNLSDIIDRVGMPRLDPSGNSSRESVMNEIAENLSVNVEAPRGREQGASIVELRIEGHNPEVLADTVREIADLFIAENRKDRAQQAASTSEFLNTELTRIRFDVSSQEKKIRDFRMENLGALPSQLDANNQELDRLSQSLSANLEAQERLAGQRSLVRGGRDGGATPGSLSAALQSARADLMQAKRVYTEDHPNIRSLRAQIRQMEDELADEVVWAESGGSSADPALARDLQAVDLTLASRRREEASLRERIQDIQQKIAETPKNEQRLLELTRDYDTLKSTYRLLLGNKHDAALASNLEQAQMAEQFKLLRPARTPTEPFAPNPLVVIPAGLAAGLALVVFLVLWSEVRTPAFHSVETLARRLGLPVFAAIPELEKERIYDAIPLPKELDWRLVVATAPNSAAAEQYRGFAPHFLERENCRVILVTSAQPGDGKSITCANLACVLAKDVGRRVLLIDADLRRATQHKIAGKERAPGLAEVLQGEVKLPECIRPVIPNLSLLPAGASPENPLALLTSEGFMKLCEQAAENYEVVMIDSPPILPVIDAKILRRMADMAIFVVRAGVSPSGGVMRSMRELSGVAGVVFNRVSAGAFKRYYYYDAYSQYEYADTVETESAGDRPSPGLDGVAEEREPRPPTRRGHWRLPHPRAVDWFTGASCGGLLLGLTQLVLEARSLVLPASLAFSLILAATLLVVVASVLVALVASTASTRRRPTYATLVGGVLGALVVVTLSGPVWARWNPPGWVLILAGLPLLLATSIAGSRVAASREGRRPPSALLTWSGAALLLSGLASWIARGGDVWIYGAILLGAGLAFAGLRGLPILGPALPRAQFGTPCLGLLAAAVIAPFWSWWFPWLDVDHELPDVGTWPPNFLMLVVDGPPVPGTRASELLEVLEAEAVAYELVSPEPEPSSLLTLPEGVPLASRLREYGYATACLASRPGTGLEVEFSEIDDRPGGGALLAESGAWLAGAPLLLGPGSALISALGHDHSLRTPAELGSDAALWLLNWRTTRARTPFLLLVDYRVPNAPVESVGEGLESVLDALREHQIDDKTLIAIASPIGATRLRALIVPPYTWQPALSRPQVKAAVWGRKLSQSFLQIALSDGEEALRFPGFDLELAPPER